VGKKVADINELARLGEHIRRAGNIIKTVDKTVEKAAPLIDSAIERLTPIMMQV
jgi:hypothetical protein